MNEEILSDLSFPLDELFLDLFKYNNFHNQANIFVECLSSSLIDAFSFLGVAFKIKEYLH